MSKPKLLGGTIVAMVLWNGEELRDCGQISDNYQLMHLANFIAVNDEGELYITKDRYNFELHLSKEPVTQEKVDERVRFYVQDAKDQGNFGRPRRG